MPRNSFDRNHCIGYKIENNSTHTQMRRRKEWNGMEWKAKKIRNPII